MTSLGVGHLHHPLDGPQPSNPTSSHPDVLLPDTRKWKAWNTLVTGTAFIAPQPWVLFLVLVFTVIWLHSCYSTPLSLGVLLYKMVIIVSSSKELLWRWNNVFHELIVLLGICSNRLPEDRRLCWYHHHHHLQWLLRFSLRKWSKEISWRSGELFWVFALVGGCWGGTGMDVVLTEPESHSPGRWDLGLTGAKAGTTLSPSLWIHHWESFPLNDAGTESRQKMLWEQESPAQGLCLPQGLHSQTRGVIFLSLK